MHSRILITNMVHCFVNVEMDSFSGPFSFILKACE